MLLQYFIKSVQNFWKKFSGKINTFSFTEHSSGIPPHFCTVRLLLDVKQQKNKLKFGKKGTNFPTYSPGKKWSFLQKWQKIVHNITIRTVSLLYKKCVKCAKNIFCQIWSIFNLGEHAVHTPPFLCITSVYWWFTTKKQPKMGDILSKFLPGGTSGKFVLFLKIAHQHQVLEVIN